MPERIALPLADSPHRATAERLVARLRDAGFVAYFVGGCVRDTVLGVPIQDIDIATSAPPAAVEKLFRRTFAVGESFGVMIVREEGHGFEVATFRTESGYADRRRPSQVAFSSPEEDVKRRDFTINALFYDPATGEVVDYVGGLHDLRARILRTVGDPVARFEEDALRLMRAVRFAGMYDLRIEDATWQALKERAPLLAHISRERIGEEWGKTLTKARAPFALHFMTTSGLLAHTLPEVAALGGETTALGAHALEATTRRLDLVQRFLRGDRDAVAGAGDVRLDPDDAHALLWAALLYEVGRPAVTTASPHPLWEGGAAMQAARAMLPAIATRMAMSRRDREFIAARLDRAAAFQGFARLPLSRQRELLGSDGAGADLLLLAVYRAVYELSSEPLDAIAGVRRRFADADEPLLPPPLVDGADLIREAGMQPGPHLGRVLAELRRRQLEGETRTRDEALAMARGATAEDAGQPEEAGGA